MTKSEAVKHLERRRKHLADRVATGYYSQGRSEHWVRAEVSALEVAITALTEKAEP